MTYETIITETHGRVGLVRLNRPKALNALNNTLIRELADALTTFDADPAIGAMVLTGSEKAFAAGADIKEMAEKTAVEMVQADMISTWDQIAKLDKPLIAAVAGFALGGGCELAMMCDMIIAGDNAVFGQPEINLGVIPGAGGTQRLTHAVGKAIAMEMILNDRRITAEEAAAYGLVNRVVPAADTVDEALVLAAQIAQRAPVAIRLAKESIKKAYETSLQEGLAFERRNFYFLFSTHDQKEGMEAFINKRKAEWRGQ